MRFRHLLIGVLVFLLGAQGLFYYPILPSIMASHFGFDGIADGFASKQAFFVFEIVLFVLIFVEVALLPYLLEKMPDSLINLPNKLYWLVPERRSYSFDRIKVYLQWFGVGLLGFSLGVAQLVYTANLTREPLSEWFWGVLAVFVLFVIIWIYKFVRDFRIPV